MRKFLFLFLIAAGASMGCQKLNTFEVDATYCYQHLLPLMQFSVDYPADLQTAPPTPGQRNQTYNYFFKSDAGGNEIESISFGYLSLDTTEQDANMEAIIGQMEESYMEAGFELSDTFTGTQEFDGKQYKMFRCTGTIDRPQYDLSGTYRVQTLILTPEFYNNGLMITMMARDDSPIQSYDDFAEEGSISKVWKSLEIEEPDLSPGE